jgi:predicted nucleotidyltransferase
MTDHQLVDLSQRHHVLALYLFGSRADDGLRVLRGESVEGSGADLDIGVVFVRGAFDPTILGSLQSGLEGRFAPLRVDLVPLQLVDGLFQYAAISGHRVAVTNSNQADEYELEVMRHAAELLPIQRRIEIDLYGVSNR